MMKEAFRRLLAVLAVLLFSVGLAACSSDVADTSSDNEPVQETGQTTPEGESDSDALDVPSEETAQVDASSAPADAGGSASEALASLPIKGRAPKTGYSRDQFGPSWSDVDHNGCDTRNDILKRDLTDPTYKPGTNGCVVLTGTLDDPYTATQINFQRGQDTSNAVQIDHVVALSDAWQKGAQQLDEETRKNLANDPYNLLAVDGPANQQKSDGDAATWLPANKSFRCEYVARQIGVKQKYGLWVTQAEHDAMSNVLASCPAQTIPEDGGVVTPVQVSTAQSESEPEPAPASDPTPAPQPQQQSNVYYKNCSAARAAGAAPVHKGDPGYGKHLDRDGDGIGCE